MKKTRLLHSEISYIISRMGHTDTLVIGDCGLPIPEGVQRIDLALQRGLPSFEQVLQAVLSELEVEHYTLATEIKTENPQILNRIQQEMGVLPSEYVSHEELKQKMKTAKAVIRTGEASPYANIILESGVKF